MITPVLSPRSGGIEIYLGEVAQGSWELPRGASQGNQIVEECGGQIEGE